MNNISSNSKLNHKVNEANLECNFVLSWPNRQETVEIYETKDIFTAFEEGQQKKKHLTKISK